MLCIPGRQISRSVGMPCFQGCLAVLVGTMAGWGAYAGEPAVRAWPEKTSRVLLSDEQIAHARQLCQRDSQARQIFQSITQMARRWVSLSDEQLRAMLPDSSVPRAFDVSAKGCPVHGTAIYQFGTYPWKLDASDPFHIQCPVGGERYPSNDFAAFYRGGMKDRSLLTGPFADDGRGWTSPDGEKYWFVAYACHWHWMETWVPAVTALSRAYILSGDRSYAHKAAVMLDRIAEVYPGMDYGQQSRLGELTKGWYQGKIAGKYWEAAIAEQLVIAYDEVFDALIGADVEPFSSRDAGRLRANVETRLLEEVIDATEQRRIEGKTWAAYPAAYAYALAVRQNAPRELLERVWDGSSVGGRQGLKFILYNQVAKDGMPYVSAPGYCSLWPEQFVRMARPLSSLNVNLFDDARMPLMFDTPLSMICVGRFTPSTGDSGGMKDTLVGIKRASYLSAYREYGKADYAAVLEQLGGLKPLDYDELFLPPVSRGLPRGAGMGVAMKRRTRIFDGFGLAILSNARDTWGGTCSYGLRAGHGHNDRLNMELFGFERRLSPDLGYPDAMNGYVPGIYSWSQNTVSHNCLVVDDSKQMGNVAGKVLRLHDSPSVHVVDIDAGGSYPQASVYRRTILQVDVGEDSGYLVDVFRVKGGRRHVLSMHGPEGRFGVVGATLLSPVTEGTLAGKGVPYGQLYDDPKLGVPGYRGLYDSYTGSGYQHLFNWQRIAAEGTVTACWTPPGPPAAQLRIHVVGHPGQTLTFADAYVSPIRKVPTVLKYMLAERDGDDDGNVFVTVWEVCGGQPLIDEVRPEVDPSFARGHEAVIGLSVHRGQAVDVVTVAPGTEKTYTLGDTMVTDAAVVVLTIENGTAVRTFAAGGSTLSGGQPRKSLQVPTTVRGKVMAVDYKAKALVIPMDGKDLNCAALGGRAVRIFNERHSSVYSVESARLDGQLLTLRLGGADLLTGLIRIERLEETGRSLSTNTTVPFAFNMAGMSLVSEDLRQSVRIESMEKGMIHLETPVSQAFAHALEKPGHQAWVADFGTGDSIEIEGTLFCEHPKR